jgi:hypothetical protein
MRITEEQLAAERERMELEHAGKWFPTRWWRAVGADGVMMAESSNEAEIRGIAAEEKGAVVQHLFEKHKREWRDA